MAGRCCRRKRNLQPLSRRPASPGAECEAHTIFAWRGQLMSDKSVKRLSRRSLLTAAATAWVALPWIWTGRAGAATQLAVRTPGGVYDEVKRETVYEPFRKATGIEIVPVAATVAKLLAMHRSGQMEVDLIDTGDDVLLQLDVAAALLPLDLKAFKPTDPEDIQSTVKHKTFIGSLKFRPA